ncbi:PQQ-dependent sugar dehydrogenase [Hymenobacter elongatus]|uniref:Sorbosone dehydrogenase family protein n=1 Tax=Hymenobacter elongatus TaxID=877208 RepID=A0A4Z0PEP3_9BACT|nr:PQQ-dependent sugar dehydrogenase [Hymenobacter elongatus]TGE12847.1 sorbosone dehydrogenase family protein [Hymenobacter elongatus]
MRNYFLAAALLLGLAACNNDNDNDPKEPDLTNADQPTDVISAPNVTVRLSDLPAPDPTASAVNWPQVLMEQPAGARFQVPQGFAINLFAKVPNARALAVAPNGDIFVAQSGMNQISVLRDTNNDGAVDETFVWDVGGMLFVPYGMAFKDNFFYVTSTGALLRYPYTSGQTKATGAPTMVAPLLGGGQHPARALVIGTNKLYVGIGSAVDHGPEDSPRRATIEEYNLDGTGRVTYAAGIRNPQGLAISPVTNQLWSTCIERDGLGDELVPDYLTAVRQGGFYGYPFAYLAPNLLDPRVTATSPLTASTLTPSVLFKAHETAIGVLFYRGTTFPAEYRNDAFVAIRGSWNRKIGTGYKVVRVRMNAQGTPVGGYENFVTGWHVNPGQTGTPQVFGRPLGLVQGADGSMLIADDAGGTVWRLRYKGQ